MDFSLDSTARRLFQLFPAPLQIIVGRYTQLEHLALVHSFPPAVWLGLSQLHTLQDVDLSQVTTAAIAAALPQLHSLTASVRTRSVPADVAGFFPDLLPAGVPLQGTLACGSRCRVRCPSHAATPAAAIGGAGVVSTAGLAALRGFHGAQPSVMHVPFELITKRLPGGVGAPLNARSSLLARVRHLYIRMGAALITQSDVARVLRAAPRLHTFRLDRLLRGETSWLTVSAASTSSPDPAFAGVVHPRLRHLELSLGVATSDEDCASRLWQTCLPRLREVTVNGETFFVTPTAD
jgi:hypothetical protein